MKQTAAEWWEKLLIEQGKQIEISKAIAELSDEEIEKAASIYSAVNSINELELNDKYNDFVYAAKWYRNTLREQLKQRQ